MKKKWSFLFVILVIVTGCSAPTTTAVTTVTATPNPIFTLTFTPTLTPTSTQTPTPMPTATSTVKPTATSTPTPKPFPASLDDFIEEVDNNCAKPPEEEMDQFWLFPYATDFMEKSFYLAMFFADKVGKGNFEVRAVGGIQLTEEGWYCVGAVVAPSIDEVFPPRNYEEELKRWGKWSIPVTLVYWSSNGLVVYNYEPAMPAP